MNSAEKNDKYLKFYKSYYIIIFYILILIYGLIILYKPNFSPVDDHLIMATIQNNLWMPPFAIPDSGRFFPLDGQEFNLIAFFSKVPLAYYSLNCLEMILVSFCFMDLVKQTLDIRAAFWAFMALAFTPDFVECWLRLLVAERSQIVFFSIFLWSYLRFIRTASRATFWISLFSATGAVFTKEPSFIMVAAFACARLVASLNDPLKTTRSMDISLLALSFIYALIYYLFIFRFHQSQLYMGALYTDTHAPISPMFKAIKTIVSYSLNNPLIVFMAVPFTLWRIGAVFLYRLPLSPLADPLIFTGVLELLIFIALGIYSQHYLPAAYIFCIPALIIYWTEDIIPQKLWWATGAVTIFLLLTSVLLSIPPLVAMDKYMPRHFNAMTNALSTMIASQSTEKPVGLYMDDSDQVNITEILSSLTQSLIAQGISARRFETYVIDQNHQAHRYVDYTLLDENAAKKIGLLFQGGTFTDAFDHHPQQGDFFIVTPFSNQNMNAEYFSTLCPIFHLAWHSTSPDNVKNYSLRALIKWFVGTHDYHISGIKHTLPENHVDYYIFQPRENQLQDQCPN